MELATAMLHNRVRCRSRFAEECASVRQCFEYSKEQCPWLGGCGCLGRCSSGWDGGWFHCRIGLYLPGRIKTGTEVRSVWSVDAVLPTPCRLALVRSEEHTSELQSHLNLVCRL